MFLCKHLLCTKDAVTRVAKSGEDIPVLIELFVDRAAEDRNIGVRVGNALDALRRGKQHHQFDRLAAALFQLRDRRFRRLGHRHGRDQGAHVPHFPPHGA